MNGYYIKIMSDGSQLFEKDTECFLFDSTTNTYVRPTLKQFNDLVVSDMADFLGLHKCTTENESNVRNTPIGFVFYDVEWCELREFYFVCCYESKIVDRKGTEIK